METLILASLCVGAAAGVRLRVFVLFPLIIFSSIVVTALGLAQSETGWSIVVANFAGSVCLQLGYFAGALLSSVIIFSKQKPTSATRPPVYIVAK